MPIAMPCPTCKAKLKGPDQLVGRTLKCPGCGTMVTIPASALIAASPPPPESKAPPAPPPAPATKPAATSSLLDLPDDVGFLDEPAPAPPTKPVTPPPPARKVSAPASVQPKPPTLEKPAAEAFPNMELDEPKDEEIPEAASEDTEEEIPDAAIDDDEEIPDAAIDEDEEVQVATVEDDEEVPVAAVEEEDEVWVDPVEDEGELDVVEAVEEEDDLAVVADGPDVTFRLLQMPRLYVRSQSAMFAMTNAYDLLHAKTKKKVGEAVERPETSQQLLSVFVGKNVTSTKIEVFEGRNKLMMTIRRAPFFMTARAEIFDADDEKLGSFDILPFSALTGKPLWITDPDEKQLIKLEMKLFSGRRYFKNKKGVLLAEWVHELTYEKKLIKFKLAARGNSFYLIFKDLLDDRPRDKMLILGASLGLDLLQAPTGQRGMRFGGT